MRPLFSQLRAGDEVGGVEHPLQPFPHFVQMLQQIGRILVDAIGAGLFELMELLGRETVIRRMRGAVS